MAASFTRETGEVVYLDNTFEVAPVHTSTVSEHPVEEGVNVADHSQPRAPELTITGIVTETPLLVAGRPISVPNVDNRGREILAALRAAKDDGALLAVVVPGEGLFEDMAITSIRSTVTNVNAKRVTVTLRQVRIAKSVSVNIPPLLPNPDASPGLPDEQDVGRQATTNPESTDNARRSSLLYGLGTSFGWIE